MALKNEYETYLKGYAHDAYVKEPDKVDSGKQMSASRFMEFSVKEAKTVATVALHVSEEAASLVYEAQYEDEEGAGFAPVSWDTRRAAHRLLASLANHYIMRQDSAWFWPDVRALCDGRMTFEWITANKRVIVYLPPSHDGDEERYVIVTNERGCEPDRVVEPAGTIHHRLIKILCRDSEG